MVLNILLAIVGLIVGLGLGFVIAKSRHDKAINGAKISASSILENARKESETLIQAAAKLGVEVVLLVAPTSAKERIEAIAQQAQGFIYLVSVTGVTGIRTQMEDRAQDILMDLRTITDKPIGIGFGISQPEHAKQVMDWGADAVIVGSAFVKRLAEGTPAQGLRAIEEFCRSLKIAIASD